MRSGASSSVGLGRSSSFSSVGSDYVTRSDSGYSEEKNGGDELDEDEKLLQRHATIEDAICGVLYTLSKEKAASSFRISFLKLGVVGRCRLTPGFRK